MQLNDLYSTAASNYEDTEDDASRLTFNDLRKTRITLRQLNKMRRLADVRAVEQKEKIDKIRAQYAPPAQPMM